MPKGKKPRICAVRGCPGDRDPTKTYARLTLLPGEQPLSFFRVPAIISRYNPKYCGRKGTGENLERMIELSTTRRNAWLKAIRKENEPPDKCIKVCARHFVSGCPAGLEDQTNVDWVPTLKLVPEDNPLGKAKFLIKKLVQRQRDTSFRLKYGLTYEDEPDELKEEKIEPNESYDDCTNSVVLSENEEVEEVLIQEYAESESTAEKIKEIFIPLEPKIEARAKRKNEVPIQEEPENEPRAKKMKEVLVREQPTNESIADESIANESIANESIVNESIANEIEEIFVPGIPKTEPILEEADPSVESSIETIESLLDKGKIFLDNEATNSNITNYMLEHSDEDNGHWHLRFCKTEKCTSKEENNCEIINDVQAQPSEQKGHYHLRLCTCKTCVLSQSADKMYSLKGT